jgi:hypothetical protein
MILANCLEVCFEAWRPLTLVHGHAENIAYDFVLGVTRVRCYDEGRVGS